MLGHSLGMRNGSFKVEDIVNFHAIRDVSPKSHMYAASFRLPYDVAMGLNRRPTFNREGQLKTANVTLKAGFQADGLEDVVRGGLLD